MAARPVDWDDDIPLFRPRPPPEVVPLTTLPVIIIVAPPVPPVPPPDSDSDDEDRYRDIDGGAIGVDEEMENANPNSMQVTSSHAERSDNLSCSLKFQPTLAQQLN